MNHTAMASLRRGRGRVVVVLTSGALVASMLAAGLVIAPAVAASFPPGEGGAAGTLSFSGTGFTPATVCQTSTPQSFSLTVTVGNLAGNKKTLQTLFLRVPTGYTVTNPASSSSVGGSQGKATVLSGSPAYIRVGSLNAGATATVTVTFSAATTTAAASSLTWFIEGETGNDSKPDLDKPDGDDYYAPTLPMTTVALNCQLVFTATGEPAGSATTGQPADAGATQNITNAALTPTGSPVTVSVESGAAVVPVAIGITLTLAANPSNVVLAGGGGPATTNVGVASFGQPYSTGLLSVTTPGSYTLTATASLAGIPSVNSTSFRIWGAAATCTGSCQVSPSTGDPNESFTVVGPTGAGGAIGASVDIGTNNCSTWGFAPIGGTHTLSWESVGQTTGNKQITLSIADPLLMTGASLPSGHYMVCMSAQYPFKVAWTPTGPMGGITPVDSSIILPGTWYTGLLPDCQDVSGAAPCILSEVNSTTDDTGVLTVTVLTAPGDPFGR